MISSNAFNYINVLDKAADASWLRESVITNNIANVNTPGYKRQEVDFQTLLKDELGKNSRYDSLDKKIMNTELGRISAGVMLDRAAYSYDYRLDGNNVDIDTKQVELASEQLRYNALTDSITEEFSRMKMAMSKS